GGRATANDKMAEGNCSCTCLHMENLWPVPCKLLLSKYLIVYVFELPTSSTCVYRHVIAGVGGAKLMAISSTSPLRSISIFHFVISTILDIHYTHLISVFLLDNNHGYKNAHHASSPRSFS